MGARRRTALGAQERSKLDKELYDECNGSSKGDRARSRACSTVARTRTVTRYVVSKPCIVRRASFVRFPFFSDIVVSFSVLFRSLFLCLLARRLVRSFGVVSRDDRVWIIVAWSSQHGLPSLGRIPRCSSCCPLR